MEMVQVIAELKGLLKENNLSVNSSLLGNETFLMIGDCASIEFIDDEIIGVIDTPAIYHSWEIFPTQSDLLSSVKKISEFAR